MSDVCPYPVLVTAVVFRVYDVDRDGFISKDDLLMVGQEGTVEGVGVLPEGTHMVWVSYASHLVLVGPVGQVGLHTVQVK